MFHLFFISMPSQGSADFVVLSCLLAPAARLRDAVAIDKFTGQPRPPLMAASHPFSAGRHLSVACIYQVGP